MSTRIGPRFFALSGIVAVALMVVACGGDKASPAASTSAPSQPAAIATPAPAPTPQAVAPKQAPAPLVPDGNRVFADIRYLVDTVGSRPKGEAGERLAADYIGGLLKSFGYSVELQEFEVVLHQPAPQSTLSVVSPPESVRSAPLRQSAPGIASGRLILGGHGRNEIPASAAGAILLIERDGVTPFDETVAQAQAVGAAAVIIYDNTDGQAFYNFGLGNRSLIPVLAISRADGLSLAKRGPQGVDIKVSISTVRTGTAKNVVARPPSGQCDTVTGGHYDTVPQTRGADDNASGTATVVEVARVMASKGEMGNNCFVLFSAEESNLDGSRAYVSSLSTEDRRLLKGLVNFDMTGTGQPPWLLFTDPTLRAQGLKVANSLALDVRPQSQAVGFGSDYLSFEAAGLPYVWLFRNDNLIHTPLDVVDRLQPELLEQAAHFGVAMLESLAAGG